MSTRIVNLPGFHMKRVGTATVIRIGRHLVIRKIGKSIAIAFGGRST